MLSACQKEATKVDYENPIQLPELPCNNTDIVSLSEVLQSFKAHQEYRVALFKQLDLAHLNYSESNYEIIMSIVTEGFSNINIHVKYLLSVLEAMEKKEFADLINEIQQLECKKLKAVGDVYMKKGDRQTVLELEDQIREVCESLQVELCDVQL